METEVTHDQKGVVIRNYNPEEFDGMTITIRGANEKEEKEAVSLILRARSLERIVCVLEGVRP